MEVSTRYTCRVCDSPALPCVISLGPQRIASTFDGQSEPVPLDLLRCEGCGLVQLGHTVSRRELYERYWYRSGVNATMTRHLHDIAFQAAQMVELLPGERVIDIGCNDGTLLDGYGPKVQRIGFEPSDLAEQAQASHHVIRDFFSASAGVRDARVITSIAMFYDLEDPRAFACDVASVLAHDGVWVIECHYLPAMLERNQYDAICHEHLEYYSLRSIERTLPDKLQVERVETNDTNGGSIRAFIRRRYDRWGAGRQPEPSVNEMRQRESLITPLHYQRFAREVRTQIRDLRELCRGLAEEGCTIHAYGASTKGNVILQAARLGPELIACAAERNPAKYGRKTATGIPIVSEAESRAQKPDYYLVLPWHFREEFCERERDYLRAGGRFIWPLPTVHISERPPAHLPGVAA
jgi:hypothetical protein